MLLNKQPAESRRPCIRYPQRLVGLALNMWGLG